MYAQIKQELDSKSVDLVAVSKTKPTEQILEIYHLGHRDFGENRVQELREKYELLPKDIHWHFIGNLQSNKVKYIASFIHLIHSVDKISLLQEINKQAEKNNRKIKVLLQLKIAQEEQKGGASRDELIQMIDALKVNKFPNIEVVGLMGMATFTTSEDQIRSEFKSLQNSFNTIAADNHFNKFSYLSMGMSGDYKIAIEEGSTMVRIGSLIFGKRP